MKLVKSKPGKQPIDVAPAEELTGEAMAVEKDCESAEAVTVDDRPTVDGAPADSVGADGGVERAGEVGGSRWSNMIGYVVLPGLALLLAAGVGYLKWQDSSVRGAEVAGAEAVKAATDETIALLSYNADTVEQDLERGRAGLTGQFLEAYRSLTNDVVIPGAKQKQISAVATVPAAAAVSATAGHAVALLFVNQTVIVGKDAPTGSTSSVRVTLDKVGGRWLIAGFDPV